MRKLYVAVQLVRDGEIELKSQNELQMIYQVLGIEKTEIQP